MYNYTSAYQNAFNNYQPYSPLYPQKSEVVKVNGQNGAEAYSLAPNSSILLLDEKDPIVYLKVSDGAGYATVTPYTISPYVAPQPISVNDLDSRLKRLEELFDESDITTTEHSDAEQSAQQSNTRSKKG